jgi:hypothetical protein
VDRLTPKGLRQLKLPLLPKGKATLLRPKVKLHQLNN